VTEPTTTPVELSYGRQAPAWRRRRYWIIAALVIAALLCGYFIRRQVSQWYYLWSYRREAARWYANALTWSEPPTKLKYTENPADADWPNGKFMRSYGTSGGSTLIGFKSFGGASAERRPVFNGNGQPILAAGPDDVMLFLHERTTPGGMKRLVAVRWPHFDLTAPSGKSILGIDTNVIGLFKGDYRILKGNYRQMNMTGIADPGEIRLFAGQADPSDASKFSIPFEARGRKGWIDGQFVDGQSFSKDPASAKIEAEINSGIELKVRIEQATTAPAAVTQPAN
jgi:hypothetical protein